MNIRARFLRLTSFSRLDKIPREEVTQKMLRMYTQKEINTILDGYWKAISPIELAKKLEERSVGAIKLVHYQYKSFMDKSGKYEASLPIIEKFIEYNNERGYKPATEPVKEVEQPRNRVQIAIKDAVAGRDAVSEEEEKPAQEVETPIEEVSATGENTILSQWYVQGAEILSQYVKARVDEEVAVKTKALEKELEELRAYKENVQGLLKALRG